MQSSAPAPPHAPAMQEGKQGLNVSVCANNHMRRASTCDCQPQLPNMHLQCAKACGVGHNCVLKRSMYLPQTADSEEFMPNKACGVGHNCVLKRSMYLPQTTDSEEFMPNKACGVGHIVC